MPTTRRRATSAQRAAAASSLVLALLLPAAPGLAEEAPPAPASSATTVCAEALAAKVQSRYDGIQALEARFEQETRAVSLGHGALGDGETSRGTVLLAKPGRMRWHYQSPNESLTVSNGEVLWLYDPIAREASRYPVSQSQLTGAALQFLMGDGRILDSFRVSASSCRPGEDGGLEIELVPREPASYERMKLRAHSERGDVLATTIVDLFGNETTLRFSEMRFDPELDPEAFEFEPPEGVQVVDLMMPR